VAELLAHGDHGRSRKRELLLVGQPAELETLDVAAAPLDDEGFHPTVLVYWRARLRASARPRRIFDAVRQVVEARRVHRLEPERWPRPRGSTRSSSGCRRDRGSQHGTPERHHLGDERVDRYLNGCAADVSAGRPARAPPPRSAGQLDVALQSRHGLFLLVVDGLRGGARVVDEWWAGRPGCRERQEKAP
jgi:hypothetical protein